MVEYVKIQWPEYQAIQLENDWQDHSFYCDVDDSYFVEKDWYSNIKVLDLEKVIK